MAAVGKFVLWGKENLCLIRARAGALLLETLFFAEDVRAKTEIEEAVAETDVQKAELQHAEQVISSLAGEWAPVLDLKEALRQSVADAQSRRTAEGSKDGKARAKAGSRSRKTPAKKSA